MSTVIQVKRGTEAQILENPMAVGELALCTSTCSIFSYNGVTKCLIGKAIVDTYDNMTTYSGVSGRFFFSSDTGNLYVHTGTVWSGISLLDNYITSSTLSTTSGNIVSQIIISHGSLQNLNTDDHTQYFLADGSRELSGNLLPEMTGASGVVSTRDLGSPTQKINNIYVHDVRMGGESLYVNDKLILYDTSPELVFRTDANQDLSLKTYGLGDINLISDHADVGLVAYDTFSVIAETVDLWADVKVTGKVSSSEGFQINEAAPAGQFLRSNGTVFFGGTIQTGDIPDISANYITPARLTTVSGDLITQIPSLEEYATQSWANGQFITPVVLTTTSGDIVTQIPSLTNYVTTSTLSTVSGNIMTQIPDVVGGRLDYVSTTQIKWSFLNSNQVRIFNNSTFLEEVVNCSSEPTLSSTGNDIGGVAITYDTVYDIFAVYTSATTIALAVAKWAVSTAGSSARYAAWVTSTDYKVGDKVSNGGSYYPCIAAHTSDTFATDLAAGKWGPAMAGTGDLLGLDILGGSPVFSNTGAWRGYRWLGTVTTFNDSGSKFKSSTTQLSISNYYNAKLFRIGPANVTASWTYDTAVWRESNTGTGQTRAVHAPCRTQYVTGVISEHTNTAVGGAIWLGIAVDSSTTNTVTASHAFSSTWFWLVNPISFSLAKGYHYITSLEYSQAGVNTIMGGGYLQTHIMILA